MRCLRCIAMKQLHKCLQDLTLLRIISMLKASHLNRIGEKDSKKFAQSISKQASASSGSKRSLKALS